MQPTHSSRPIVWAIALISIAVAWQLNIPKQLITLSINLGVTDGSILYHLIVDGGISVIFVGIAWMAIRVYEDILWPWWPKFGCKRGWWIYGLITKSGETTTEVVGFFHVLHTTFGAQIIEAHSFYFKDDQLIPRGDWHADAVWIFDNKIKLIFNMHAVNPVPEATPARYEGYLSLNYRDSRDFLLFSDGERHLKLSYTGTI